LYWSCQYQSIGLYLSRQYLSIDYKKSLPRPLLRPQTAQNWLLQIDARIKILIEMHCSLNTYLLKKVCHAHPNAHKPPKVLAQRKFVSPGNFKKS